MSALSSEGLNSKAEPRPKYDLKCKECHKSFLYKKRFKAHLATHHPPKSKPFKCPDPKCSKWFETRKQLRDHERSVHRVTKTLPCPEPACGKMFQNNSKLRVHLRFHNRRRLKEAAAAAKTGSTEEVEVRCEECGMSLRGAEDLKAHIPTHLPPKSHKCGECGRLFRRSNDLKTHKIVVHELRRSSQACHCHKCGKDFNLERNLKVHLLVHGGEKPFTCPLCPNKFTQKGSLDRHLSSHRRQEKPFPCPHCEQEFPLKHQLRLHSTTLHRHPCTKCGKIFPEESALSRHLVSNHAPKQKRPPTTYTCPQCPEKHFKTKFNLASHSRIHSGLKNFSCNYCQTTFRHKANLNRHVILTHEKRVFLCGICRMKFRDEERLLAHINTHTSSSVPPKGPFACPFPDCDKLYNFKTSLIRHRNKVHSGQVLPKDSTLKSQSHQEEETGQIKLEGRSLIKTEDSSSHELPSDF
jgi:KRAB domain-containing zinc finger protein